MINIYGPLGRDLFSNTPDVIVSFSLEDFFLLSLYGRQSHKACVSDYIPAHTHITPACIVKYMASSELSLVHQTFRRRLSLILFQALQDIQTASNWQRVPNK
jgi:hypothetical protein